MDIDCLKLLGKDVLGRLDQDVFISLYQVDQMETDGKYLKDENRVAIKIYERIKLIDRVRREIVKREIEILQKVKHPNIIELIKARENSRNIYLVMEYLGTTTLKMHLENKKPLLEHDARHIFK